MVKPLVTAAAISQRFLRATVSAIPGADLFLAQATVASAQWVPSPAHARLNGERTRLGTFQDKAAGVLFQANPSGAQRLLDRVDLDHLNPEQLERLATRYIKIRRYSEALAMRERAAELEPQNPLRWIALARSQQRSARQSIIHDPVMGLTAGPQADPELARQSLTRAQELAPKNPYILHERGLLEFHHGDAAQGLEFLRESSKAEPTAQRWMHLASAYRKPHVAELDASLNAYEQALLLKPASPTAFRGLAIMGCRADQDWPRLWASAEIFETARKRRNRCRAHQKLLQDLRPLFTPEPSRQDVSAALVRLEVAAAQGIRLSYPVTALIVYRLQFAQRMTEAFRLRRDLAQRSLDWLGTNSAGHSRHRQKLLSALVYLGQTDQAQKLIDPMPWTPLNATEAQRLEKMAADVHLIQGNAEPLIRYAAQRAADLPLPGEEAFRKLIEGKRVAVVGPADTGDRLGDMIDAYDIIIRPRLMTSFDEEQAARLGTRTDIAYFSGRDLGPLRQDSEAAVAAGDLQMVVGRGLSHDAHTGEMPDWLRYYRHDYSLGFHGPPMGIGRILYDVLQFAPAEIGLFNIDFFSGENAFGKGYRDAKDQAMGPYSIVNEIVLAHDLAFEHRLTRAMVDTGVLQAYGVAGEVLGLSEEAYIRRLDTSPAVRTRRDLQDS